MRATHRWHQRFTNFTKAFNKLRDIAQAAEQRTLSPFEQQGLIKAFEFTYETAWLTLKDYLVFQGYTQIAGPRDTIRAAFRIGVLEDGEGWMEMIQSRNQTVHTYHEEMAHQVMARVLQKYMPLFEHIAKTLPQRTHD